MALCKCGCGGEANPGRDYIKGHNRRGTHHTPEAKKKNADARRGIPRTPSVRTAIADGKRGTHYSPEHCTAIKQGQEKSGINETMRGGNDIVNHHYIYDKSDLSLNTVKMTRSDHTRLHHLLRKLGYIVPHINL